MDEKKKILIVEDELDFAKMVKIRLESVGYAIDIALDTYQGTQMICKNDFDLVILDLMIPAGGGFTLLNRIRKMPAKSTIPVVILTGKQITNEIKANAKDNDVAVVFTKPYNSKQFVKKIKSLVPE